MLIRSYFPLSTLPRCYFLNLLLALGFRSIYGIPHCVKSVRIRSYPGPTSLHIQSECGKIRNRITPNTDTFYAVLFWSKYLVLKNMIAIYSLYFFKSWVMANICLLMLLMLMLLLLLLLFTLSMFKWSWNTHNGTKDYKKINK